MTWTPRTQFTLLYNQFIPLITSILIVLLMQFCAVFSGTLQWQISGKRRIRRLLLSSLHLIIHHLFLISNLVNYRLPKTTDTRLLQGNIQHRECFTVLNIRAVRLMKPRVYCGCALK